MLARLLLLFLSMAAAPGATIFLGDQATADSLLASATVLNTSSPALTRGTAAYDPVTDSIAFVNVRRQRNVTIGSSTYAMDLSEANSTNLLAIGTSGRFDRWTAASGLTTTAGSAAAPNGEVTAQTLTDPGASLSSAQQTFTVANDSLNHVFSIYVKKTAGGTAPTFGVTLALTGGTGVTTNARINTDTGAQQYGSNANTTIETSSAGTWYRIMVKVLNNTSGNTTLTLDVYPAAAAYGASVDDATATGSAICAFGCLVKRGWAPSFVSNRNMLLASETFGTNWTATRSSVSVDLIAGPLTSDLTADKVIEDSTATSTHVVTESIASAKVAASVTMTTSVYAKADTRTWIAITAGTNGTPTNGVKVYFDIGTGATGTSSALGAGWANVSKTITSAGSGWYRCSMTYTTDTGTACSTSIRLATGDTADSYTGNGTSDLYLYGAQLEYASAPTTYWATTTASGLRTRDALVSTTSISITAGTLMFVTMPYGWTGAPTDQTGTPTFCGATNTALNFNSGGANFNKVDAGGTEAASFANALGLTDGTLTKTFGTWDATALNAYSGTTTFVLATPDTTLTGPWSAISTMPIGHSEVTNDRNDDAWNLILYWPSALTPAQEQILINATH